MSTLILEVYLRRFGKGTVKVPFVIGNQLLKGFVFFICNNCSQFSEFCLAISHEKILVFSMKPDKVLHAPFGFDFPKSWQVKRALSGNALLSGRF